MVAQLCGLVLVAPPAPALADNRKCSAPYFAFMQESKSALHIDPVPKSDIA